MKMTMVTVLLSFSSLVFAGDFTVDKDHSHMGFQVKHMVGRVPGEFKDFEGTFSFDPKKPDTAWGKFKIKAASIFTNNEKRDGHLRSQDFFDANKYPELSFESKKVTKTGKDKFKLSGDLTIHGITKPAIFNVEYNGMVKDPMGETRAGFTASSQIDRKEFGMVWNKTLDAGGLLVGEKVDLDLSIEAIEKVDSDKKTADNKKADSKKK